MIGCGAPIVQEVLLRVVKVAAAELAERVVRQQVRLQTLAGVCLLVQRERAPRLQAGQAQPRNAASCSAPNDLSDNSSTHAGFQVFRRSMQTEPA